MVPIIYKISNTIDDRLYIGSSVNKNKRWAEHLRKLIKNSHENIHLQRFVNKYGHDKLVFEEIELCTVEALSTREKYYIDLYKGKLFNISLDTVAPMLGIKHTKDAIAKISFHSTGVNNGMYGKTHSEKSKEVMRIAQTGRIKTKREKLLRLLKLKTRKEVTICKGNEKIRCISYAHAAQLIGVKQQSIEKSVNSKTNLCDGWKVTYDTLRVYDETLVDKINLFDDNLHPQPEMIQMLKSL